MYKEIITGYLTDTYSDYDIYEEETLVVCDDFGTGLIADIAEKCEKYGNYLKFRYYISEKPFDLLKVEEYLINTYFGIGDISIISCGCPTCGHMCVKDATIGGHNIYQELLHYLHKYCIIEVEYYKNEDEMKGEKSVH